MALGGAEGGGGLRVALVLREVDGRAAVLPPRVQAVRAGWSGAAGAGGGTVRRSRRAARIAACRAERRM